MAPLTTCTVAGFPGNSRRCGVIEGFDAAFRAACIEFEEMYTNSRRASTAKVRFTTAAQAQAALT